MSQEKRKHPRFDTSLDVVFYDQKRTKAKLVNISKKGCLLTMGGGKLRAVDSMITFRVFFEGIPKLRENTMPQISLSDISKPTRVSMDAADDYSTSVKIIARVARHLEYQGVPAMGMELLELDGNDLIKWNTFLTKKNREELVLPFAGEKKEAAPAQKKMPELPTYSIQFKSLQHAIQYFSKDPEKPFFIPSPPKEKDSRVKISMVHPENGSKLNFIGIVQSSGPNLKNAKVTGVYVRFESFSEDLKNQINQFLNHMVY